MTTDKLAELVACDRQAMADLARIAFDKPGISFLDAFNEIRSTIYENTSMIDAAVVTGIASAILHVIEERWDPRQVEGRGTEAAEKRRGSGDFSTDFSRDFEQD